VFSLPAFLPAFLLYALDDNRFLLGIIGHALPQELLVETII